MFSGCCRPCRFSELAMNVCPNRLAIENEVGRRVRVCVCECVSCVSCLSYFVSVVCGVCLLCLCFLRNTAMGRGVVCVLCRRTHSPLFEQTHLQIPLDDHSITKGPSFSGLRVPASVDMPRRLASILHGKGGS